MQQVINNSNAQFYCVSDIQRILRIGRNSAYKLITTNDFPSIQVGKRIIVPIDRFNNWVDNQITGKGGVVNG
jgi:hypothetical protein